MILKYNEYSFLLLAKTVNFTTLTSWYLCHCTPLVNLYPQSNKATDSLRTEPGQPLPLPNSLNFFSRAVECHPSLLYRVAVIFHFLDVIVSFSVVGVVRLKTSSNAVNSLTNEALPKVTSLISGSSLKLFIINYINSYIVNNGYKV